MAGDGPAPLPGSAHGRHGAALWLDRRDEDRRGQDPRFHPAGLSERAQWRRRACGHRERLPGSSGCCLDGTGAPLARIVSGPDRLVDGGLGDAPSRLCLRRNLRYQHRVRFRLLAGQHVPYPRRDGAAGSFVRDCRRGRLDPDRRGPHPADHLGAGNRVGPLVLPVCRHRPDAAPRGRLRRRRGEAHSGANRGGHCQGGAPAGGEQSVRGDLS